MNEERLLIKIKNYKEACTRLKEVVCEEIENDYIYDATIQRFEFTFELAWKMLKEKMESFGIEDLIGPRIVLQQAYKNKMIEDIDVWENMLRDRNLTSHIYNKKVSKEIYDNIKKIYLKQLLFLSENV